MCGIVGYIGKEQAAPILLEGLARLEERRDELHKQLSSAVEELREIL